MAFNIDQCMKKSLLCTASLYIYIDPEDVAEEVVNHVASQKNQLTEWFVANQTYAEAAKVILYQDFPEKFVWDKRFCKWTPKKGQIAIGYMHFVHPSAGEQSYLCLLFTVVKGAAEHWDD